MRLTLRLLALAIAFAACGANVIEGSTGTSASAGPTTGSGGTAGAGGAPACKPNKESCTSDTDCCTGKCVEGACSTPCAHGGEACSAGAECCSGTCAPSGCTCAHDGASCNSDDECCVGICKQGHCACAPGGASCNDPVGIPCCAYMCSFVGQGEYQCSCQSDGAYCLVDEQCCSGHCANGGCVAG